MRRRFSFRLLPWVLIPAILAMYGLVVLLIQADVLGVASSVSRTGIRNPVSGGEAGQENRFQRAALAADLTSEVYVAGAQMPVTLAFAPDGRLFFNELSTGRVRVVVDGVLQAEPVAVIPNVRAGREYGLIGLALHPDFEENGYLYVYYTEDTDPPRNRILRFTVEGNRAAGEPAVILDDIPAGVDCCHNGGNMRFGPDGKLYVGVGDTQRSDLAQDQDSLVGKILRLNPDGSAPRDNPFFYTLDVTAPQNYVYALGFRNPYDMVFNRYTGDLLVAENGDWEKDEVNVVEPGENYGWPEAKGKAGRFRWPLVEYTPVIAPSGIDVYTGDAIPVLRGDILMCSFIRGEMIRIRLNPPEHNRVVLHDTLTEGGCLLDVTVGPDGYVYYSDFENIYRLGPAP